MEKIGGQTEVELLKGIVLLYGVSVVNLAEIEVPLLKQWLAQAALSAP